MRKEGQNPKRKTYIGHLKFWGYKLQEVNIHIDNNDKIQDLIWHKLYTINTASFEHEDLSLMSQLNIFTDGSKTKQHVGAGFTIRRGIPL